MTELSPQEKSLVAVVVEAAKQREVERSDQWAKLENIARRGRTIKELVVVVIAITTLVGTGAVFVSEIRDKPTLEQVESLMAPVQDQINGNTQDVDAVRLDLGSITSDLKRVKQIQDYQLEQSAWQGEVVDHIGQRKAGKPPKKPATLKAKERDLIK
jgi:hypothetical protein